MTRSKKKRRAERCLPPREKTTLLVDATLHAALTSLLSSSKRRSVGPLGEVLSKLRADFDPSTVTMSSTNIPDALVKLSYVLAETKRASCRVFELIERQKTLLSENSSLTFELLKTQAPESDTTLAFARLEENTRELRTIANEIMVAHEFQDLCGQNITKVMRLISGLDVDLREFFRRIGCEIPPRPTDQIASDAVTQGEADDILGEFGL